MTGHDYAVLTSDVAFEGRVISVRRDVVSMPGATSSQRDVVVHPGAVAVVALRGEEVLLVSQYRHPVERRLEELPAGLLDVEGETALLAAQRELAEEGGFEARQWQVLLDVFTSPGMTDEAIRIYLARDLQPCHREVQEHEEVEMTARWEPLATAVQRALSGALENAVCVLGVLAGAEAGRSGFLGLRPADAPWPARPRH